MKIERIHLAAYGPFSDALLDFAGARTDFHLIFGPNEAGKSSALRALRHMLFGIPVQTADSFRHAYPNLRIGARLVAADGKRIDFLRRKGRVKTLRGADDESILPDDALAPFLGGIDQAVFEQMFAIGHEDLVRGGEEIVSGRGRIGEALFSAGAGLVRLQAVQQGLEQDCAALFKPGGSAPRINQCLAALKEVRRVQKEALLQERTWRAHDQALRDARERMVAAQQRLGQAKQRAAMLQRFREALPLMARRQELAAALAGLEGVPDLPDDFGEKRREVEKDLKIAARDQERSSVAIARIAERIEALAVPEALLSQDLAVEALQRELGSFRKARQDRPGLDGRMRTLRDQAAEKLVAVDRDIGAESAASLTLPPAVVGEIQDLAKSYERLSARLESARDQHRRLETRLQRLAEEFRALPAAVDVTGLETVLQAAQEAGLLTAQIAESKAAAAVLQNELAAGRKRQTVWDGPLETLDALCCPSRETIDRFEAELDDSARRRQTLADSREAAQEEIARTRLALQTIDRVHQVPTEEDLAGARSLRDRGWHLIRRRLSGEALAEGDAQRFVAAVGAGEDLAGAFEESGRRADRIADRLRHEAEQVSRKELLVAMETQLTDKLADMDRQGDQLRVAHETLDGRWHDLWRPAGILPLSPREMRAWLAGIDALRAKLAEWRRIRAQVEAARDRQRILTAGLRRALVAVGAAAPDDVSLAELVHSARSRVEVQKDQEMHRAALEKDLSQVRQERHEAAAAVAGLEKALAAWQADWDRNLARIRVPIGASPTAALAVIECLKDARGQIAEAETLRKRIEGIDRDAAAFGARVAKLVTTLAPDLAAEPPDRAAEVLGARLTAARRTEAERRGLLEQLQAKRQEQADAARRVAHGAAVIEALCAEARCAAAEGLAEAEQRARTRREMLAEGRELETRLRTLGAGVTVDAFVAEASTLDADAIGPELDALSEEMEQLESERSTLDQTIGTETAELKRMDGGAEAAVQAARAEDLLAGLEADVAQYARLKIAAVILARTVEKYREKHQGPLIARSSELFAAMTLGAFERLRAEYDEKGSPMMVGIRADGGAAVGVEAMSDGTADQLYLALRLASLERYLENGEPLPLVVDDILLRFDDRRALATLEVLADLSGKTQVIFFTHHRHLMDLAAAHLGDRRMASHRL